MLIAALIFANGSSKTSGLTPPSDPTPIALADGRGIGAADAPVTLDVWADFQCPGCGIFTRATEARIVREYVANGKLRLVFHDYAFIGQESIDAAVAARRQTRRARSGRTTTGCSPTRAARTRARSGATS